MTDKINVETSEIDLLLDSQVKEISKKQLENDGIVRLVKTHYRYFRKFIRKHFGPKKDKNFTDVLYVTTSVLPVEFISAFRKQYPDKKFSVLMPLENIKGCEKPILELEIFIQNESFDVSVYELKDKKENIKIYGLFFGSYMKFERSRLQYLGAFAKAVREFVRKFNFDIVHVENIPYFLGCEFEKNKRCKSKILQIVSNFSKYETDMPEAFWAAINLADKRSMKRITNDRIIRKYLASLYKRKELKKISEVNECLDLLYQSYDEYKDSDKNMREDVILKALNARILELFPKIKYDDLYYNIMYNSIKQANGWACLSETYYKNLFLDPELSSPIMLDRINKTRNKSSWVTYGYNAEDAKIYKSFTVGDFRDYRFRNKKYLIRELSQARIKTNFIDTKFFLSEEYKIKGYLDSFYESPLVFGKFNSTIFDDGADIALAVMLKLFEMYKNVQFIINIPNGFENKRINALIEFLEQRPDLMGRWLFIDAEINLAQFFAASDIAMFPARENLMFSEHFIAMKYGCIPVSSKAGILNDTIIDIFDDILTGCGFKTNISPLFDDDDNFKNYYLTLTKALDLFVNNASSWNPIIKNAMNYNSSWSFKIIENYNRIYDNIKP